MPARASTKTTTTTNCLINLTSLTKLLLQFRHLAVSLCKLISRESCCCCCWSSSTDPLHKLTKSSGLAGGAHGTSSTSLSTAKQSTQRALQQQTCTANKPSARALSGGSEIRLSGMGCCWQSAHTHTDHRQTDRHVHHQTDPSIRKERESEMEKKKQSISCEAEPAVPELRSRRSSRSCC